MQTYWNNLLGCLVLFVLILQGCAVGNVYNLSDVRADLQISPAKGKNVAVATYDRREQILSGVCDPTYIGMQRAGFGNPWRVNTESGLPLADDLTKVVSESLSAKGYRSLPVNIKYTDNRTRIMELLRDRKAERSLLFIINKWESDTFMNIGLKYEIELNVYDENLIKLSSTSIAEVRDIPGSAWNAPMVAKEQIPLAFKRALENLIDPKIQLAIQESVWKDLMKKYPEWAEVSVKQEAGFIDWALKEDKRGFEKLLQEEGVSFIKEIANDGRFTAYNNRTVIDARTGLMWAMQDNGSDINWQNAKSYCESYRSGGYSDWRLPTQDELAGLYDGSKPRPVACYSKSIIHVATKLIDITCYASWASETRGSADAHYFSFNDGDRTWLRQSGGHGLRAIPVRSVK